MPEAEKVRRLFAKRSVASLAAPRSRYRRNGNLAQRGALNGDLNGNGHFKSNDNCNCILEVCWQAPRNGDKHS